MTRYTNWAGNITFGARALHRPTSIAELQSLVGGSDRIRTLGTGHSFNEIADTTGDLVSVSDLPHIVEVDTQRATVTVSGGLRYGEVTGILNGHGFALPNLGSLPHISIAGACATGTHGSGDGNGILATAVSGLQLVTADGELVELSSGDDEFLGAVLGLGSLGVVTQLTLDLVPAFQIAQYVYEDLPLEQVYAHFDAITSAAYSVSVFTDWRRELVGQVWLKSREPRPAGEAFLGAAPAPGAAHPVPGVDPEFTTQQLGVPGPWHERLPHFRLEFTPSSGEEIQSEYFVAREHAVDALRALSGLGELMAPVLQISEIRTIAADRLWISPANGRDRVGLHFTWIKDIDAVEPVLVEVEKQLAAFDAVPHWGKVFRADADTVARLHPKLADFAALVRRYDPAGKLVNDFTTRYVLG